MGMDFWPWFKLRILKIKPKDTTAKSDEVTFDMAFDQFLAQEALAHAIRVQGDSPQERIAELRDRRIDLDIAYLVASSEAEFEHALTTEADVHSELTEQERRLKALHEAVHERYERAPALKGEALHAEMRRLASELTPLLNRIRLLDLRFADLERKGETIAPESVGELVALKQEYAQKFESALVIALKSAQISARDKAKLWSNVVLYSTLAAAIPIAWYLPDLVGNLVPESHPFIRFFTKLAVIAADVKGGELLYSWFAGKYMVPAVKKISWSAISEFTEPAFAAFAEELGKRHSFIGGSSPEALIAFYSSSMMTLNSNASFRVCRGGFQDEIALRERLGEAYSSERDVEGAPLQDQVKPAL